MSTPFAIVVSPVKRKRPNGREGAAVRVPIVAAQAEGADPAILVLARQPFSSGEEPLQCLPAASPFDIGYIDPSVRSQMSPLSCSNHGNPS